MPSDEPLRLTELRLLQGSALLAVALGILSLSLPQSGIDRLGTGTVSPERVWSFIQPVARDAGLDPSFVYAIIWAESSLNPRAKTAVARGMMQLTRGAWERVSTRPYRQAWDWQTNIIVGVDYLVYCKRRLEAADRFSYPLLAASYRFGPNHVRNAGYDFARINSPRNRIYQELFAGNLQPVPPP